MQVIFRPLIKRLGISTTSWEYRGILRLSNLPRKWNNGMVEYWNIGFIVNPADGGTINPTLHYPRTHYSTITLFHHSNCERSELTWTHKIESIPSGSFMKSISYKFAFLSIIATSFVIYMSSLPDRSYLGVGSATEQIISNLAHIPAFALLSLLWIKTINLNGKGSFSNLFVLSGLALFAVSTEFLQSFVPGRMASFMDFGLNIMGILLGFLIFRQFAKTAF